MSGVEGNPFQAGSEYSQVSGSLWRVCAVEVAGKSTGGSDADTKRKFERLREIEGVWYSTNGRCQIFKWQRSI